VSVFRAIYLCLVSGVVLLKLRNRINCEKAHVIGVDEAHVVQVVLLLEDYLVEDLF